MIVVLLGHSPDYGERSMMKKILIIWLVAMVWFAGSVEAVVIGDIDADGVIGLDDAILALQVLVDTPEIQLTDDALAADANFDNRIGMEEAFFILEILAAKRVNYREVYDVGPGKQFAGPEEVPWESLTAGNLVRIYPRQEPYLSKWVIAASGTAEEPVVIRGVSGTSGERPIICGEDATTRRNLDYWNEARSVIKVGGSSYPDSSAKFPSHIIIENLHIRTARPPYQFTDDNGNVATYAPNAAAIHVEEGRHIAIRNCILQDAGNGLFAGHLVSDLVVEANYIHSNGIVDSIYEHNSYTECNNITFQFNHYGPLRTGCRGNNLKDRSVNTVVRYNWIDQGNRTLDLVDSDYADFYTSPAYRNTWVYGNILIKGDANENGQIVHYGGDSGVLERYRKGTLWFFNNTVVSYRTANTTLFGLSSNDEHVSCFNNIMWQAAAPGDKFAIMDANGIVSLTNNLLPVGWRVCHCSISGSLDAVGNMSNDTPGFVDHTAENFHLLPDSPAKNLAMPLPSALAVVHPLNQEYLKHQSRMNRVDTIPYVSGAFGY